MKLGTFMMPLHPPSRPPWQTLAEDREAILLADRLGFCEAYVGEHTTDLAENVTSCLMFLASLAHDTKQIVLGSGTLNLPNTHPAAVAGQVAMLDHMLKGRFIMGISPGGLMSDAEVFGNYGKDRNEMFLECINTVLAIWAGEGPYKLAGKHYGVTTEKTMIPEIGQGTIIKPYKRPHPRIVVTAVAPHSKGVTEAAKRGWQPISANFLLPEWVASHWPKYAEGRIAVGATPDPAEWRVAKSIFVADDEATAKRYGHGAEGPYHFYFKPRPVRTRLEDHPGLRHAEAGHRRHRQQRGRPDPRLPGADRPVRHAALSLPRLDGPGPRPAIDAADGRRGDAAGQCSAALMSMSWFNRIA
ncbi:MAG: LLM class flavin-dependent oxidoreductase [Proteobacteria bacterium]|nr:LLM class flavin-dependent oxidoreductase [Pseudomonadota bacterium]